MRTTTVSCRQRERSSRMVWAVLVLLIVMLAACGSGSSAPEAILTAGMQDLMATPPYNSGRWGLLAVDVNTGEVVYSLSPNSPFVTGSTAKTFSVGTVLDVYGPDHRFSTPLVRNGNVDGAGALNGDLILVAQGDLTMGGRTMADGRIAVENFDHTDANAIPGLAILTSQNPLAGLNDLARQVASSGVHHVTGDVIVDDRLWDTPPHGPGEVIVTPIIVNDNLIDLMLTPTALGQRAGFDWRPRTEAFEFLSEVVTGAPGSAINLTTSAVGTRVTVSGSIPSDAALVPVVHTWQVPDPPAFARTLMIEALKRVGVTVAAEALGSNPSGSLPPRTAVALLPVQAVLVSPPLSEEAKLILKVSHNLGADTMPMLLAVREGERTYEAGMRIERSWVGQRVGVPPDLLDLNTGSGSNDRLTPKVQELWLRYLMTRPSFPAFFAALPILGMDGSLTDVCRNSPAAGFVHAKTGTLMGPDAQGNFMLYTKALAGYADTVGQRRLAYALYVNDIPISGVDDILAANNLLGQISVLIQQTL
jgi:D-alanyl-D-alanine carboxypeptidase/D-alanyl-D-alanine-endopeptidase (penicillin-binding protein 4)